MNVPTAGESSVDGASIVGQVLSVLETRGREDDGGEGEVGGVGDLLAQSLESGEGRLAQARRDARGLGKGAHQLRVEANALDGTIQLEPFGSKDHQASRFFCADGRSASVSFHFPFARLARERSRQVSSENSPLLVKLTSFLLNPPPALQASASALPASLC